MKTFLAGMLALGLVACAGTPVPEYRGWIGGRTKEVVRKGGAFCPPAPAVEGHRLIGMPKGLDRKRAVLIVDLPEESPLRKAGLRPGDLLLDFDGKPVRDPRSFRKEVEERAPGEEIPVSYWRDGIVEQATVKVGKETFERQGVVGIGLLPFLPRLFHVDLWPFDDGFDLFGLVAVKWDSKRRELHRTDREWLARTHPGKKLEGPTGETVDLRVFPLWFGVRKRILSQKP